jgi:hypothetical protein
MHFVILSMRCSPTSLHGITNNVYSCFLVHSNGVHQEPLIEVNALFNPEAPPLSSLNLIVSPGGLYSTSEISHSGLKKLLILYGGLEISIVPSRPLARCLGLEKIQVSKKNTKRGKRGSTPEGCD